jgi:hypothetical protein
MAMEAIFFDADGDNHCFGTRPSGDGETAGDGPGLNSRSYRSLCHPSLRLDHA